MFTRISSCFLLQTFNFLHSKADGPAADAYERRRLFFSLGVAALLAAALLAAALLAAALAAMHPLECSILDCPTTVR